MKPLLRVLALGVGPLVVAASLAIVQGRGVPPQQLALTPPPLACTQPPVFTPGYQAGENYVIPQGEGFKFRAESWLEADLCSAGTLKITADGELAGDEEPQLTVVLDGTVFAAPAFNGERTVELPVPRSGHLLLGYFNDYYLADVRVATLRDVAFTAPTCEGFRSVVVPKETGGVWNDVAHVATLVRAVPMTLTPCAAGTLSMRVIGREGQSAFPELQFQQAGKTLKTFSTSAEFQKMSLAVGAAPLAITLTNPYGETLADRNLNVRRLEFIPRRP
ncbi:hypothetical protein HLB42_12580 [Deinococcus sp. D7000]|nr:hypothetical protein HLB42_12580 [Deinococcus sp. D7000]